MLGFDKFYLNLIQTLYKFCLKFSKIFFQRFPNFIKIFRIIFSKKNIQNFPFNKISSKSYLQTFCNRYFSKNVFKFSKFFVKTFTDYYEFLQILSKFSYNIDKFCAKSNLNYQQFWSVFKVLLQFF